MRTIKFRGKRLDNGEWVHGDLLKPHTGTRIVNYDESEPQPFVCRTDYHYYDVRPETVGQFTGLLDKDETPIYEGDIVRSQDTMGYSFIGLIGFNEGCFGFVNKRGIGTLNKDGVYSDGYCTVPYTIDYEVIGNIHDNPELLNEK